MSSANLLAIDNAWEAEFPVCILLGGLSLSSFIIRITSRLLAHEGLRLDDLFMMIAMILALTLSGFNAWLSKDQSPATQSEVTGVFYQKMNLISHLLWITALSAITHSVLAFYWRLFKDQIQEKKSRRWFWSSVALVFVWWFTAIMLTLFVENGEVDGYWSTGPNTRYLVRITYTFGFHILLDVNVLAAPYFWIRMIERRNSRRLIILLLYFAGISTTVFSTVRFGYLIKRYIASKHNESNFELGIKAVMWSVVEVNVAIICANLPTYRYNDFGQFLSRIAEGNEPGTLAYERNYGKPNNTHKAEPNATSGSDSMPLSHTGRAPSSPPLMLQPVSPLEQQELFSPGAASYELRNTSVPQPELPTPHTGWRSVSSEDA